MFTQCPDCNKAFRVTADVLKKAAGKVRCGGCGVAFNALEHLSEERPGTAPRAQPNDQLAGLTPEVDDQGRSTPQKISAEQSAALLKTLDELAGSNIMIEDTGIEWRVRDSDTGNDEPSAEDQAAAESQLIADTGSMKFVIANDDDGEFSVGDMSDIFEAPITTAVDSNLEQHSGAPIIDEYLTDSPTPVDEFLTATPSRVDSPEVFTEAEANSPPPVMRFDDNTPLPDDFDLNDPTPYAPEPPTPVLELQLDAPDFEDPQVDLALGDPEEWEQLLDEVAEPAAEQNEALAAETVDAAPDDESTAPAETRSGAVAENLPDMDTQFAIQAEAMGIDLSGIHQSVESDGETTGVTDPDVGEQEKVAVDQERGNEEDFVEVVTDSGVVEPELALAGELDDETYDEADQSGIVEPEMEPDEEEDEALVAGNDDEDLESVDAAAVDEPDLGDETSDDELKTGKESEIDDVWADIIEPDDVLDDHLEDELAGDDPETSIDEDLIAAAFESEAAQLAEETDEPSTAGVEEVSDEHYVPPQTEEEMTINMMIDQDIMRLAAEGEEIFTSTIVDDRPDIENKLNVETIIMEGDFVRTALESEALAANAAKDSRRADDAKFPAAGIGDKTPVVRGGQRDTDPPSYGLIAAALVLGLILVGQILHQSREALATVPEFSEVVGPIYRMVGRPLTPAWDVTGWRFEAATSKRDDVDNALIIYARIGNTSVGPLPYPLVHLSLIDLKLEIIGSKVLEPSEYLAGDPDPRKPVAPGDTFDAVIAIESASANADGFKLEACYRLASRQLRCAIPAFK